VDELSDTKIRNATPANKEYAIADGQGLSVVVRPNGTKLWLYRYRFAGKRKNMSFGTFPGVGLKAAREKRHNAEKLLDQGQDPVAVREAKRQEVKSSSTHSGQSPKNGRPRSSKKRTRPSRRSSGNAGIWLSSIVRSATDRFARSLRQNC
jgi:hypothetical protein